MEVSVLGLVDGRGACTLSNLHAWCSLNLNLLQCFELHSRVSHRPHLRFVVVASPAAAWFEASASGARDPPLSKPGPHCTGRGAQHPQHPHHAWLCQLSTGGSTCRNSAWCCQPAAIAARCCAVAALDEGPAGVPVPPTCGGWCRSCGGSADCQPAWGGLSGGGVSTGPGQRHN